MRERVRTRALELGFDDCRFATADPPGTGDALLRWFDNGRHGEMEWLRRNSHKRVSPIEVLPGARSIILLAAGYGFSDVENLADAQEPSGFVARYARHLDYHDALAPKLKALTSFVNELGGDAAKSLWYADTGPVLERDLGQRAGLGFAGKHTNLIHPRLGNWLLLAEILTTLPLAPDEPAKPRCGKCVRCIEACPTKAITAPYQLDARRCVSYLTIELKGAIPEELRPAIGNRIFGCDDCLEVCPWNRFAREGGAMMESARPDLGNPGLLQLLELDEAQFKARFQGTPIYRVKRRGLLRNVCVALGNIGDASALPRLRKATMDTEPLVAEHARWAIARIEGGRSPSPNKI